MLAVLFTLGSWLVREVIVKAGVIGGLYWLMAYVMPLAVGYVDPFVGTSGLTSMFNAVPDGIYWGFYAMKLDVGLPLVISAVIARFLIRRVPVIG